MIDVTDFVSRCDRPVSDIGFAKVGGRAIDDRLGSKQVRCPFEKGI